MEKLVIKFAKEAPAPITTNNEGSAQHIKVDDEANKDKKFSRFILHSFYRLMTCISIAFCPFIRIFSLISSKMIS